MAGFCLVSLFLIASREKGAKGVARSGFPLLVALQNGSSGAPAIDTALLPLRSLSLALMRVLEAMVLCLNR